MHPDRLRPERSGHFSRYGQPDADALNNLSTAIVIEHHLDVVARADWVLDMGPGAGSEGGRIVFEGVPAKLVKHAASPTGQHLAKRVA